MRQGLMQHSRWARAVAGLCFAFAIAACGGSDPATRETPPVSLKCQQLLQQLDEAVATPGSCVTDADCDLIGGQAGTGTCNCAPAVLECGGHAIERNAPGLARARELIAQVWSAGCAPDGACDCAPSGPLRCGADHRCTAAQRSCNLPPTDAGTDPSGW